MNLRKRKSTETQVANAKCITDHTENTAPSFLTEEERGLNQKLDKSKRVKLEEVKTVLTEKIKAEDESYDINDYNEENSQEEDEAIDIKVSEKKNVFQI